MWSLGTLFGNTLKVDMKYTREKCILRILVGCLDFRRIPTKERIFIADGFYDISFEVEAQRDLVMTTEVNPGEAPSDHDGHGNNDDSTSETQKNLDAMETDVAPSRHDQEGSKNAASNSPDINKLAGDFSSGVKFSPRVKHMMKQSKIKIAAFINSLAPSAAVAEEQPNVAAASMVDTEATCAASAAGAENLVAAGQPAVEVQATLDTASAAEAGLCTAAANPAAVEAQAVPLAMSAAGANFPAAPPRPATPADAAAAVGPRVEGAELSTPTKDSFRASSENSGTVLHGQKTPASPLYAAKETAPLSPITRDDGCISSKSSETSPAGREKGALLGKGATRIAAAPFSPSTSKSRRIKDVIAFGGISEKIASPVRSSQRVRMQHNGNATQMVRATQLAERRIHAITPGTKSNLSFSKFFRL
jgi:hypothetical protein